LGIETNVDVIGYRIEISNNKFFNKLLYTSEENLILDNDDNIPLIDNFQFDLHGIFTSWDNIPQLLVVRTCFIDKLNMNVIYSNPLVITDEYYKYIINENNFSRITSIVNRQASPNLKNNIYNKKMDFKYFNFIDKVNCVVVKNDESVVAKSVYKFSFKEVVIWIGIDIFSSNCEILVRNSVKSAINLEKKNLNF
jgi:hypothetical protein